MNKQQLKKESKPKDKEPKPRNKRCVLDKRLKFSQASNIGLCWSCDTSTLCAWKNFIDEVKPKPVTQQI